MESNTISGQYVLIGLALLLCVYQAVVLGLTYFRTRTFKGQQNRLYILIIGVGWLLLIFVPEEDQIRKIFVAPMIGVFGLYLLFLSVKKLLLTRSWAAVRGKVNLALLAFVFLLVGGPFSPVETWGMFARVLWTGVSGLLFLLALWNMLWITFTKKDFPPFAPLATGIPLALYFCMLLFAYKEFF